MIKVYILILTNLFLTSCIDLFTNEEFYESIYLRESGWLELYENNIEDQILLDENFTLQIWFSGEVNSDLNASCILNINSELLNLSIYKAPNTNNSLMLYVNQVLIGEMSVDGININNTNNFYLLSVIIENQTMTIFLNDNLMFETTVPEINNSEVVIGALKVDGIISNLWSGYIDEIRLWNNALTVDVIDFHSQYPYKISSAYSDEHLEYLIGLWDFKINKVGQDPTNIFQDINNNDIYVIIYTLESMTNELSTNGR